MDFKQIEAFVNVARFKSFTKAADAMFFTQPTISAHVTNLENELGVKLFDRNGRIVELTPQGTLFYKHAVEMINERELAIRALEKNKDNISGILQIGTSSIPGTAFLPQIIAEFRKLHGNVRFNVSQSDTEDVIESLINRKCEIGFVGSKISNSMLDYKKIFKDKTVMIAPKSFNLGKSISIENATRYPYIWREEGSATRKSFERAAEALGYEKNAFEIAALFNDFDSIVRSVESGLGVAVISEKAAEIVASDRLDIVKFEDFNDDRNFYMVSLNNATHSLVAERFKDFVLSKC